MKMLQRNRTELALPSVDQGIKPSSKDQPSPYSQPLRPNSGRIHPTWGQVVGKNRRSEIVCCQHILLEVTSAMLPKAISGLNKPCLGQNVLGWFIEVKIQNMLHKDLLSLEINYHSISLISLIRCCRSFKLRRQSFNEENIFCGFLWDILGSIQKNNCKFVISVLAKCNTPSTKNQQI